MTIDLDAIKKRLASAGGMRVSRESITRQVSEMYDALADTPRDEHYDQALRQCQAAENRAWAKYSAQETFMGHARGDVSELVDEVDRLRAENARLQDERDGLLVLTELLDEHPDDYGGPCLCKLCMSYGEQEARAK